MPLDRAEAPERALTVEERARKRVRARNEFITHVVMYVAGNLGLYAVWRLTGAHYPWFLWLMVGWGIGIVAHAVTLMIGPDSPNEERAIRRELDRLRPRREA